MIDSNLKNITASRSPIGAARTVANSTPVLPLKLTAVHFFGTLAALADSARWII